MADFRALFPGEKWTKLELAPEGRESQWMRVVAGGQTADFGALFFLGEIRPSRGLAAGGRLRWLMRAAMGRSAGRISDTFLGGKVCQI